jgi:hypothetical protein
MSNRIGETRLIQLNKTTIMASHLMNITINTCV